MIHKTKIEEGKFYRNIPHPKKFSSFDISPIDPLQLITSQILRGQSEVKTRHCDSVPCILDVRIRVGLEEAKFLLKFSHFLIIRDQ